MNGLTDKRNVAGIHKNIIHPVTKKEILPYVATWLNLEDIMLSAINQHRKTIPACFIHMRYLLQFA